MNDRLKLIAKAIMLHVTALEHQEHDLDLLLAFIEHQVKLIRSGN